MRFRRSKDEPSEGVAAADRIIEQVARVEEAVAELRRAIEEERA